MAAETEETGASSERILLQDEDGVFLEIKSSPTTTAGGPGDGVTRDPLAGVEEGRGSAYEIDHTSELMAE